MVAINLFSFGSVRPPDQQPDRLACNWVLISAALAIAIHYARFPLWLSCFAGGILLWRFFIDNHAWRIPRRWLRWPLLLVTTLLVLQQYGTLLGRDPGVAFLTLLVALKILEIRSLRDYLLAVFLIYLLVLGALLYSQSLTTGICMGLLIVVTTHTLVLLNRPRPLTQAQSLRLSVMLCLQALPLLLILYLLFPRIQGSLWGLPQDAFSARTGMSEQVAPGSINQLYNDDTIAFRVDFDGERPAQQDLYWRAFVLSDTDGQSWQRHRGPGDGRANWQYRAAATALGYTVLLEPHHQRWLPALDLPTPTRGEVRMIAGYALETAAPVRFTRRYQLKSHLRYLTGPPTPAESVHNTRWPKQPSHRVKRLLGQWRQRAAKPKETVQQALHFFNQEPFSYTLSPPLRAGDTLDAFLFDSRAGYCEHYASAFVALMRLSRIPARLVVGYQGGEWNRAGDYLIVRQSDAHAWAEVWLKNEGWVRVDPTAAVAPERVELGASAIRQLYAQGASIGQLSMSEARRLISPTWLRQIWQDLSWRWDAVNNQWNIWVMHYGREAQFELLQKIGVHRPHWLSAVVTVVAVIFATLLLFSALWLRRRQKQDPVVRAYEKFCNKLLKTGLSRQPTEGPLDFCSRLIQARADLSEQVARITATYIELRYGHFSADGLARLRQQVDHLRVT